MALTDLQKASFKHHIHSTDQIFNAETGDVGGDAENVAFDPTGLQHITGENVQAALEDLDAASGGIEYPTVSQAVSNENNAANLTLTVAAPTAGHRLILGTWSIGRDTNSVTQTNVTWTKITEGASASNVFVDIWVGVAAVSAGTTITIAHTGANFNGGTVVEVADALTPTLASAASSIGGDIRQPSAPAALSGQTVGRFFVATQGTDNGTIAQVMWCSVPHIPIEAANDPLKIGYIPPHGRVSVGPTIGTTGADYVTLLATIT